MPQLTEVGTKYSVWVGCIYLFNLIVGTGALSLPAAFARAGWLLSSVALFVLATISFVTTTYVIEALACANAVLSVQPLEDSDDVTMQSQEGITETASEASLDQLKRDSEEELSAEVSLAGSSDLYSLDQRVELGMMAHMFYSRAGIVAFYTTLCLYLYGDLAIYAVAVAKTLMKVICTRVPVEDDKYDTVCFKAGAGVPGAATRLQVYRLCLLVFTLTVGPFCFFNVQKTKYLQIFTTCVRWLAFGIMVTMAIRMLFTNGAQGKPPVANFAGLPTLFGSSVYAFMCHHSLPGLLSPIDTSGDHKLAHYVLLDYLVIAVFYVLLADTGAFAFPKIYSIYTLNFVPMEDASAFSTITHYYLALFPVFTLSTSFPIIAITLRNNMMTLCLNVNKMDSYSFAVRRLLFPIITVGPPIMLTYFYQDVTTLIKYTGAYAGSGIQYVIPTCLVIMARRKCRSVISEEVVNDFESPFAHHNWAVAVLVWAAMCLLLVSANLFE